MKKEIYTVYSAESDMTFIMEYIYEGKELKRTEVKGFYFGSPDDNYTKEYYGKLKADFQSRMKVLTDSDIKEGE